MAHPEGEVRARVTAALNDHIAAGRPLHRPEEIRAVLTQQRGTPLEPFSLDPPALDLAVRLVRLVFAARTPDHVRRRVCLVGSESFDRRSGLVLNARLQTRYVERFRYGLHRFPPRKAFRLVAPALLPRLRKLQEQPRRVQVMCRKRRGFSLIVQGELPWRLPVDFPRANLIRTLQRDSRMGEGTWTSSDLSSLGLEVEFQAKGLRLHTTTPESRVRFGECLDRGDRLTLRSYWPHGNQGRIVVALSAFAGTEAQQPALAVYLTREPWLRLPAGPPCPLGVEERLALARWLYVPASWADAPLLETLLSER